MHEFRLYLSHINHPAQGFFLWMFYMFSLFASIFARFPPPLTFYHREQSPPKWGERSLFNRIAVHAKNWSARLQTRYLVSINGWVFFPSIEMGLFSIILQLCINDRYHLNKNLFDFLKWWWQQQNLDISVCHTILQILYISHMIGVFVDSIHLHSSI